MTKITSWEEYKASKVEVVDTPVVVEAPIVEEESPKPAPVKKKKVDSKDEETVDSED